jgi:hypothetical protein
MDEVLSADVSSAPARDALYRRLLSDSALRGKVRELSRVVLGQEVGSCTNCFVDAIIQLKLKGKHVMETKQQLPYKMRAGAVINDIVNFDASKVLTAASCTEELALYHLSTNPSCRKFFSELPDDVDERIAQYAQPATPPTAPPTVTPPTAPPTAPPVTPPVTPPTAPPTAQPPKASYFDRKNRR